MPAWLARVLASLLKFAAPKLAIYLLAAIDPVELADKVRPALKDVFEKAGPEWQKAFKEAWDKTDAFVDELLNDPNIGK